MKSRLEDLLWTGDRQLETRSYEAAIDTFRTALGEPGAIEAGVADRLEKACRDRDEARGIAVPPDPVAATPLPAPPPGPPPLPREAEPVRYGRIVINAPGSQYTPKARAARIEGTVVLGVEVAADGSVTVQRVVKGLDAGLDDRALEMAKSVRFQPLVRDGQPTRGVGYVEVKFKLG